MSVCYYKRFRMEVDLTEVPATPPLPTGYFWVPWNEAVLNEHALVKFRCFVNELDAKIFPCLGNHSGCQSLMREIASRRGFVPQATWLIGTSTGYVGTIQGVVDQHGVGMIQNLGVVPEARGRGLGTALLLKALHGFRDAGLQRGMLEVTAQNTGAVRLYRRIGFRRARTVYKAVETY